MKFKIACLMQSDRPSKHFFQKIILKIHAAFAK